MTQQAPALALQRSAGAEDASAVCEMLTLDCSGLLEEIKKNEGIGSQLAGLFVQSDAPNVKELTLEALAHLQQLRVNGPTLDAVRKSTVFLRPFVAACEQKHNRLIPYSLTVMVKLVQRKLISHAGRQEIINILVTRTEKVKDERALLCALQICLALLQDPNYADDEDSIGQLLSLVLRIHETHAVALPTVAHTASSTVRQAVALIFDHAMLPVDHVGVSVTHPRRGADNRVSHAHAGGQYKDLDGLAGREIAALKLLRDLITWTQHVGHKQAERNRGVEWLNCKPPFSEFLLDLLELILRERAAAFHNMPRFTVALRNEVCQTLGILLKLALAEKLPPPDTIKVLRCVGAVLRKHVTLAPDKCALFFQDLLACLQNQNTHVLVRCHVLDIFRSICADPMLIYRLFEMYDQAMEFDLNAVADILRCACKYPEILLKRAADPHNQYRDEYMQRLEAYYNHRITDGKDPAYTIMETQSAAVESSADMDVLPAFLGLECAMGLMSSLEQLAVRVRGNDAISALQQQNAADKGTFRRSPDAMHGVQNPTPAPPVIITPSVLATLVDMVWRPLSSLMDSYLQLTDKRTENSMTLPLVTSYQYIVFAAGVVHVQTALNGLLLQLTSYAITGPEDRARKDALSKAKEYEGGTLLVNTLASALHEVNELWPKNRTVLKAVLELTKRLAEDLGSGWMYVLDSIICLDRYLDLPGAKWRNENDRPDDGWGRRRLETLGEVERERVKPGTGKDLLKEKEQWRIACDEVFVTSRKLSSEAVVGLMGALYEVSRLTLSDSWRAFQHKSQLDMLKQALQVLKVNLHLTQELWGLFLSHCMLVLRSSNEKARAAALKALDEGIMKALSPEATAAAAAAARQAQEAAQHAAPRTRLSVSPSPYIAPTGVNGSPVQSPLTSRRQSAAGVESLATTSATLSSLEKKNEDIQNMLLVAVDSLFREHAKLDVQLGLLKIVLHVLQHYGEDLTLGWLPLLRLLEAASGCKESALVTLGWQCVELLCSDYLYMLPKEHVAKALDVLALFAKQDIILNVSLTAVTMLWNVADTLARSKGVTKPASDPSTQGGYDGKITVQSTSDRRDVSEAESVEMLLIAFRALRTLSLDIRPEVRNSAVRTLFMAMGSHGSKFPESSLKECVWDMSIPLITTCHHLSQTSSNLELGPSEIGKDKEGKVVTMLMHHSRNTEQKQWEETLTLTLAGVTKVLRSLLPSLVQMEGWEAIWEQLMEIISNILATPRKGLSGSCTTLISTLVTAHGASTTAMPPWMWRAALQALDPGVQACAGPGVSAPSQVRQELLACITSVHGALRDQLTADDVRLILGWLDRFARFPFAAEDSVALIGMGPIQRATLVALQQLAPPPPGVWPVMLETLCAMLCPHKLLPYRSLNSPMSAAASSSAFATPAKGTRPSLSLTSPAPDPDYPPGSTSPPPTDPGVLEARALSSQWMSRCCDILATWYRDYTPWQVRVATFPRVVSALSECMSTRHWDPTEELWRSASLAFVAVVQSGLPSINIAAHAAATPPPPPPSPSPYSLASLTGLGAMSTPSPPSTASSQATVSVPADTWPSLKRAFELSLLGRGLPTPLPPGAQPNPPLNPMRGIAGQSSALSERQLGGSLGAGGSDGGGGGLASAQPALSPATLSDVEIQAAVLDCLADTVLTSCQYAPQDVRSGLVGVIDAGAATPLLGEMEVPAASRFSHACLSKLYVLCSRSCESGPTRHIGAGHPGESGSGASSASVSTNGAPDGPPVMRAVSGLSGRLSGEVGSVNGGLDMPKDQNARCLIEVAQVALPAFLGRCEGVLRGFVFWERSARSASVDTSEQPHEVDVQLCDRTVHVLELLSSLHVSAGVMDSLMTQRPELRPWVETSRARRKRGGAGAASHDRREQTHLVPFYALAAELLMTVDTRVRTGVRSLLLALGKEVGLPVSIGSDVPYSDASHGNSG